MSSRITFAERLRQLRRELRGLRLQALVLRTLLGQDGFPKLREGHASIVSSVSNLANTIIGSGESFFLSRTVALRLT